MPGASLGIALGLVLAQPGAAPVSWGDLRVASQYAYLQQYDSAGAVISRAIACRPDDPAGYFAQALLIQLLIYDTGTPALLDSFYRLCDRTTDLCDGRLDRNSRDALAHFVLGTSELNRAKAQAWQQHWFSAGWTVLGARGHVYAARRLAPDMADARFGATMMDYAFAYVRRVIYGARVDGTRYYRELRCVARDGMLCREAALLALAWVMAIDGTNDSAVAISEEMLERYPGNRSVMRLLRDNYLRAGRCRDALAIAAELDKNIRASFPDNRYAIAENWYKTAKAYEQLGIRDSTLAYVDRLIVWEPYKREVSWIGNYVRDARKMKARLER